jgi:hypothetical protein
MRVILDKINEWWQIVRSYLRNSSSSPTSPVSPALPPAVAAQKWVMMGALSLDEKRTYADPMDEIDNILLEGDSFNTRTI